MVYIVSLFSHFNLLIHLFYVVQSCIFFIFLEYQVDSSYYHCFGAIMVISQMLNVRLMAK
jgi:hypothetical protein